MSKQRTSPKGKFKGRTSGVVMTRVTPARPDSIVVYGMKSGTRVVQRDRSSGRFTTPTSAQAIDETVTAFRVALQRLADK